MKESHVQWQILDYSALNGIFHYRNNPGAFKQDDGHFYRFGALGSPDIICVIDGQYVGIEVKAPREKCGTASWSFRRILKRQAGDM